MFCVKCGSEIPDDSVFCDKCGSKQSGSNTVEVGDPKKENPISLATKKNIQLPSNKIFIFAGVGVAALLLIFVVFQIFTSSGKNYLYTSLAKSSVHYQKEFKKFIDSNAVLNQAQKLSSGSSSLLFKSDSAKISLHNDRKKKILNGQMTMDYLPARMEFFLSDDKLILGSSAFMYVEANPKALGKDVVRFADNNGVFSIGESIGRMLDPIDLSYSKLMSLDIYQSNKDLEQLRKRYLGIFKQLINKSNYKKESGKIDIGSKTVKSTDINIKVDTDILLDWLKADVVPAVKSDKVLEVWIDDICNATDSYYDYDSFRDDLVDLVAYLEKNDADIELILNFSIYKGVIVKFSVAYDNDGYDISTIEVEATGEKNRLDRIKFTVDDNYNEESITIEGNHIGNPTFTSDIQLSYDGRVSDKFSIEWDTKGSSGNLRIKAGSDSMKYTFALADGEVKFSPPKDFYPMFSLTLAPLEDISDVPDETLLLRDITVKTVLEKLGDTAGFISNFF